MKVSASDFPCQALSSATDSYEKGWKMGLGFFPLVLESPYWPQKGSCCPQTSFSTKPIQPCLR